MVAEEEEEAVVAAARRAGKGVAGASALTDAAVAVA